MNLDAWFLFENSNNSPTERKRYGHQILTHGDISITSNVFIYKMWSLTEQNFEALARFVDNDSPLVLLDEMYRPGTVVDIKRNFYGVWRENINAGTVRMINFIKSTCALKLSLLDSSKRCEVKTNFNFSDNLLVANDEKWERRKNLTGVVLQTTTVEVTSII